MCFASIQNTCTSGQQKMRVDKADKSDSQLKLYWT